MFNYAQVGHLTGMYRPPAGETSLELAQNLGIAVAKEIALPLVTWDPANWKHHVVVAIQILSAVAVLVPLSKQTIAKAWLDSLKPSLAFAIIGATYLFSIIILRWHTAFDGFNFRLLNPGAILLILAGFNVLLNACSEVRSRATLFLFLMAGLSLGAHSHLLMNGRSSLNYAEATLERVERYRDIPPGSIVLFGNIHTFYLRPDLHIAHPRFYDEPWDAFIKTLDRSRRVFVDFSVPGGFVDLHHVTVRDFIAQHRDKDVSELARD
jgi:hypothetical protein